MSRLTMGAAAGIALALLSQLNAAADMKPVDCKPAIDDATCAAIPGRILCGRDAPRAAFPWSAALQAELHDSYLHLCGAAIVDPERGADGTLHWQTEPDAPGFLLTAAHCLVHGPARKLRLNRGVRLRAMTGTHDIKAATPGHLSWADQVCIHPGFDPETGAHDVAIVRLLRGKPLHAEPRQMIWAQDGNCWSLRYETTAPPVPAEADLMQAIVPATPAQTAAMPSPIAPYAALVVTGWGMTTTTVSQPSCTLQQLTLPVVDDTTCRAAAAAQGWHLSADKLCAGFANDQASDCDGDSGGPVIGQTNQSGQRPQTLLVGLVSSGRKCVGRWNSFSTYARIDRSLDWISTEITRLLQE